MVNVVYKIYRQSIFGSKYFKIAGLATGYFTN